MRKNNEVSLVTKEDNLVSVFNRIQQKDTDPQHSTLKTKLHELKIILYYMTARETQHIKLFNILDKERRLIMTELNTTVLDRNDLQKKLQQAVEINKSLENEATDMRNAVETVNSQLLEANEAARFGEEVKAVFEIAQNENKALKEEMQRKDSEMLKLKEYVASTEEISGQLQQHLNSSNDELNRQNQLLDTAISENDQNCNEKKQLATENEHLKREIDQLTEKLEQQSKLILEQKNDSVKEQEKTTAEGMYHIHSISVSLNSAFTAWASNSVLLLLLKFISFRLTKLFITSLRKYPKRYERNQKTVQLDFTPTLINDAMIQVAKELFYHNYEFRNWNSDQKSQT